MNDTPSPPDGRNIHIVTLHCKDEEHAARCETALAGAGRPDAQSYGCLSYVFGRKAGAPDTVILVEHWADFAQLDRLLTERVIPALPAYNALLARDFDPARDTVRVSAG